MGLINLIRAITRYTGIKATYENNSNSFDAEELSKTPWVFCTTHFNFKMTDSEAENLGRDLVNGGFIFADDAWGHLGAGGDIGLRAMYVDALNTQGIHVGRDWNFDVLPNSHPLYHCFFDFSEGPPAGQDIFNNTSNQFPRGPFPFEGVSIEQRLVGIMSNKVYIGAWGNWGPGAGFNRLDNTRQLQMGVNIVIFALTQEGSITTRVVNALY